MTRDYEVQLTDGKRELIEADGFEPVKEGFSFYVQEPINTTATETAMGAEYRSKAIPRRIVAYFSNVQMIRIVSPQELKDDETSGNTLEKMMEEYLDLTAERLDKLKIKVKDFVSKL